ncbi:unnamed protein product [Cuscuta campestris]|uniref:CCHC-type domain-containing protein n=1 Tax=Cuscuta campestris TaxID=132261 RepID=A0A484LLU0_9ASTE|nr:unnamed protein product [Cuscuta campestris]
MFEFFQQMAGAHAPPPPPPVPNISIEKLKRNGAQEFCGDQIPNPLIAKRWQERIVRVLENLKVPLEDWGQHAISLLQDAAYDWWKRVGTNIPVSVPWDTYVETKYKEFSKFTQGKLALPEYRQQFDGLAEFGKDLVNTMEKRCKKFIKAAYDQALLAESRAVQSGPKMRHGSKRTFSAPSNSRHDKRAKSTPFASVVVTSKSGKEKVAYHNPICSLCGCRHFGECWFMLGLCLWCGQAGHFRKDCPTNPGEVFSTAPGTLTPPTVRRAKPTQSQRSTAASNQPKRPTPSQQQGRAPTRKVFLADLIELPHKEFDIILGMDWLTKHQAIVECKEQVVKLRTDDGNEVIIRGELLPKAPEFISYMQAKRLIRRKCEAFLCTVKDIQKETPNHKDISVVWDFPDVFSEELSGLPPPREFKYEAEAVPLCGVAPPMIIQTTHPAGKKLRCDDSGFQDSEVKLC